MGDDSFPMIPPGLIWRAARWFKEKHGRDASDEAEASAAWLDEFYRINPHHAEYRDRVRAFVKTLPEPDSTIIRCHEQRCFGSLGVPTIAMTSEYLQLPEAEVRAALLRFRAGMPRGPLEDLTPDERGRDFKLPS